MRNARHPSNVGLILAMIVASVVVHLVLWPVGNKVMQYGWGGPPIPISEGVFEVSLLPTDPEAENDRALDPEPETHDDDHRVKLPGELVQLDQLTDERPPDDANFIAEFDNRTTRETKSPNVRRPRASDQGQPGTEDRETDGRERDPSSATRSDSTKALPLGRVANDVAGGQPLDAMDNGDVAAGEQPRPPVGSLSPRIGDGSTASAMRKTFGGPSSIDHADGVDEGDATILNTARWKYASFFNRVRNAIDEEWEPGDVHKAHDPDGRVFGTRPRRTQLVVRLNPDGSLSRVRLDHSSGAPHLDEEAIRAVRAAAPFVNPPAGLIDPDTGFIEFAFGFIFEFEGKRRIFRYTG